MINELVNSSGFFYGRFPNYALVDTLSYKIYLVDKELEPLLQVKQIFSAKRNLTVIELPEQYQGTELVDNSVSIQWQVRIVPGIRFFPDSGFYHPEDEAEVPDRALRMLTHNKEYTPAISNPDKFVLEQTSFDDADIEIVKQMFMLHKVSEFGNNELKIKISKDEMKLIRREFDISLTVSDLEKNLARLAGELYANNNMLVGRILYHAVPRHYRYM